MNDYKIDYDMFSTLEVIKILEFFQLIEKTKNGKVNKKLLIEKHHEYQSILRNKALEKQYDKMLFEKSGVSIYRIMKALEEKWD